MQKGRLEGFTDGVIAIIITITCYFLIAAIWFVPHRRIERMSDSKHNSELKRP